MDYGTGVHIYEYLSTVPITLSAPTNYRYDNSCGIYSYQGTVATGEPRYIPVRYLHTVRCVQNTGSFPAPRSEKDGWDSDGVGQAARLPHSRQANVAMHEAGWTLAGAGAGERSIRSRVAGSTPCHAIYCHHPAAPLRCRWSPLLTSYRRWLDDSIATRTSSARLKFSA